MNNKNLQCYMHLEQNTLRLELAGSLSGEGTHSAYQAWETALSTLGDRTLIVDITFVSEADQRGRALLLLWHDSGARIIAASPESKALMHSIRDEPSSPPSQKHGWLERLSDVVLGH